MPALALSKTDANDRLANAQAKNRDLSQRLDDAISSGRRAMQRFAGEEVPKIATYGGAGAGLGVLLGYFLHDRLKEWFGADSYLGLLGTAALGAGLLVVTPQIFKVSAARIEKNAANQAFAYGAAIGLLGVGAWRAYQDWPAS
jgi:hypothetical protein